MARMDPNEQLNMQNKLQPTTAFGLRQGLQRIQQQQQQQAQGQGQSSFQHQQGTGIQEAGRQPNAPSDRPAGLPVVGVAGAPGSGSGGGRSAGIGGGLAGFAPKQGIDLNPHATGGGASSPGGWQTDKPEQGGSYYQGGSEWHTDRPMLYGQTADPVHDPRNPNFNVNTPLRGGRNPMPSFIRPHGSAIPGSENSGNVGPFGLPGKVGNTQPTGPAAGAWSPQAPPAAGSGYGQSNSGQPTGGNAGAIAGGAIGGQQSGPPPGAPRRTDPATGQEVWFDQATGQWRPTGGQVASHGLYAGAAYVPGSGGGSATPPPPQPGQPGSPYGQSNSALAAGAPPQSPQQPPPSQPGAPQYGQSNSALSVGGITGAVGGFLAGGPAGASVGYGLGDKLNSNDAGSGSSSQRPDFASADQLSAQAQAQAQQAFGSNPFNFQIQDAPQFDEGAVNQLNQATAQKYAQQQGHAMRAAMEMANRGGAGADQAAGLVQDTVNQFGTAAAQEQAQNTLKVQIQNYQARVQHWELEYQRLMASAQASHSDKVMALAQQYAMQLEQQHAHDSETLAAYQNELNNQISGKDWAGAGLGLANSSIQQGASWTGAAARAGQASGNGGDSR